MTKILNKIFYYLKNLLLPFLLVATIYIVMMMFQRLEKNPFGANLMEFLEVILPFVLLIILLIINTSLKHDVVRNSLFYNLTSFMVMLTIGVFCYRAMFDENLLMWHRYKYDINFTYFADQLAPIKIMLYLLIFGNIILIITGYLNGNRGKEKLKRNLNVIE